MPKRLTEFSACGGCASKLAAGELAHVLRAIPAQRDHRVLVDFRTGDDAGVYAWDEGSALVQTVDFFTPIVDDARVYGQIAAAHALSDVYAMGGQPLTALAIAAFPEKDLDHDTIHDVFAGGLEKLAEAGVSLLGGHTVKDAEVKFGYAVTGRISASRVLTNADAKAGDVLILTKPLGTGIVTTAIKFQRAPETLSAAAIRSMTRLNKDAAEALQSVPREELHACTDVTGFGLIGHASGMAGASGVTMAIDVNAVPIFDGVLDLVHQNRTGGGATNQEHFGPGVEVGGAVDRERLAVLYDPQTSGGLLIAVAPAAAARAQQVLEERGVTATIVGQVLPAGRGRVLLR
jgi:selenide,water dikinase